MVLDFETTGLSPDYGDRAIEIGVVKLVAGEVVWRFQQLMNPGQRISAFIADYTGSSNQMQQGAHRVTRMATLPVRCWLRGAHALLQQHHRDAIVTLS